MLLNRIPLVLASLLIPAGFAMAEPFKGTDTAPYLKNAVLLYEDAMLVTADGAEKAPVLQLRFDNELFAEFHAVPVQPGVAYTYQFKGQWQNAETLENNISLRAALRETWDGGIESLPTLAIEFLDAKGSPVRSRIVGVLPYGAWKDYSFSFHAPAGAVTARLKVKSGRNDGQFLMTRPVLKADAPAAAGVLTLAFPADPSAVAGKAFGFLIDDPFRVTPAGSKGFVVSGSQRGDPFALGEPGTYRISAKGEPTGTPHQIALTFFDAEGKKTGDVSSAELTKRLAEFTLPEKTVSAQLTVNNSRLESIRIERVR